MSTKKKNEIKVRKTFSLSSKKKKKMIYELRFLRFNDDTRLISIASISGLGT